MGITKWLRTLTNMATTIDGVRRADAWQEKRHARLRVETDDERYFTFTVSLTPSDHRTLRNLESQVRRELLRATGGEVSERA